MAAGGGNTDLYDSQVAACQIFFHEELPDVPKGQLLTELDEIPADMRHLKRALYLYDITGFNAHQVIAVLVGIVNDSEMFKKNKTFYLTLRNIDERENNYRIEELFRLRARPTTHQPGNGILVARPRNKKRFTEPAKDYEAINGALKAHYKDDTKSFARDIKELFLNNAVVCSAFPQATIEAYMILLFEIARRLVALKEPSDEKEQCDALPIGSAIAGIVKLLKYGKEICTFEDVFMPRARFHCFSGDPKIRRKAINNINTALAEAEKGKTRTQLALLIGYFQSIQEPLLVDFTERYRVELKETFSTRSLMDPLIRLVRGFKKSKKRTSSILKYSVSTEDVTAFDYRKSSN